MAKERSARRWVATALIGLASVLGVGVVGDVQAQVAAAADIECPSGDVCRVTATRLPLRVLPRAQSILYKAADKGSPVVESAVTPFQPLFVFQRIDVSYVDPTRPSGWFEVGRERTKADGFIAAADALEWRTAMVLSYSHRGLGASERKPVIMFKDKQALVDLVLSPKLPETAADLYRQMEAGTPPEAVITREPDTWVDIKKKFYLLPVLEAVDMTPEGLDDLRVLQLAAAVPDQRARPEDLCTTERRDFARCAREVGKVSDDELKINVVYVMDFTGSMQTAMNAVRDGMRNSARLFAGLAAGSERVKFGLVAFRDHLESGRDNEYVSRNFTPDLVGLDKFVELMNANAKAQGGGDLEEEVVAGMIDGLNSRWDPDAVKVIFLIGDASSHDPSHKFATTDKSPVFVRNEANLRSIQVAAIYIKNRRQAEDWAKGLEQFRMMANNPGAAPTFRSIEEEDVNAIQNGIAEATAEMVDRLRRLYAERPKSAPGASDEGPLKRAFEVGLVEFIGKATEPPKDITAWVADRDLTNIARRSFDVHVLVSRTELDQLTRSLQLLIDAYEQNSITNEGFFKTLQTLTTVTALDVELSRATALAKTNILPRWIQALPYRSEVTSLRFADFEEQTAEKRQQLQIKLRSLVDLYKSVLERREAWQRLNDRMAAEDTVYPLPLDSLP